MRNNYLNTDRHKEVWDDAFLERGGAFLPGDGGGGRVAAAPAKVLMGASMVAPGRDEGGPTRW